MSTQGALGMTSHQTHLGNALCGMCMSFIISVRDNCMITIVPVKLSVTLKATTFWCAALVDTVFDNEILRGMTKLCEQHTGRA